MLTGGTGCQSEGVPMARVRILKGEKFDCPLPPGLKERFAHLPLDKAREGEALGEYEILQVFEMHEIGQPSRG